MLHPLFDNKMAKWLVEQGYTFPPKLVVSFSGGKDSTAMVELMLSWGFKIDSLLFFDTGWEFPQMYEHLDLFEQKTDLKIIRLKPRHSFNHLLKKYRWPAMRRRWCTREKTDAISRYIKQNYKKTDYVIHCIGFTEDELCRCDTKEQKKKGQVLYPLIDNVVFNPSAVKNCYDRDKSMRETDALQYCFDRGYHWNGLYDHFTRVSCFCCPLKRVSDLKILYKNFPDLWNVALKMERSISTSKNYVTFKGKKTLHDYDRRFEFESKQMSLPF